MIVHDRDGRVEPPGGVGRGRETEPPGSGGNVSGLGVDKLIGCLPPPPPIRSLNWREK